MEEPASTALGLCGMCMKVGDIIIPVGNARVALWEMYDRTDNHDNHRFIVTQSNKYCYSHWSDRELPNHNVLTIQCIDCKFPIWLGDTGWCSIGFVISSYTHNDTEDLSSIKLYADRVDKFIKD